MFDYYHEKPTIKYCEANPQIFNIITNIFYILSAYYCYFLENHKINIIANCLICVGIGSFSLHYNDSIWGQFSDEIAMINLLNTIILKIKDNQITRSYGSLNYFLFFSYFFLRIYNLFLILFITQIIITISLLFSIYLKYPKAYKDLLLTITNISLGGFCWLIEQKCCYIIPYVYLLHGLWHMFSAISVYYACKIIVIDH